MQRANLHVLLNHRVLRLLPAGRTVSQGAHFNAVEFVEVVDGMSSLRVGSTVDASWAGVVGARHVITVSKEIVLSAGSIGTPAILLHSGIGDSSALSTLGIKAVHHLPSVGQNFTEQPVVGARWLVNDTNTSERLMRNATLTAELLDEWENNKPSQLSAPSSTHLGFLRLPDNARVFKSTRDPSAGPNTPHIELIFTVCIVPSIYHAELEQWSLRMEPGYFYYHRMATSSPLLSLASPPCPVMTVLIPPCPANC